MAGLDELRLTRRVDALLAPWADQPIPGVTIGVVQDGALTVHRSAGLASLELDVPIGPATTFRIASVSKQFTCAAILLLAADGRLNLDDDIRAHVPEMPELPQRITVAHLMHNTSGIRDMLEIMRLGGVDLAMPIRREDLLAGITRQRTLNFPPGSRFLYSNSGFMLLGLIAERVSGEPLPAFLKTRIFAPLGMNATALVPGTTAPVANLATGYLPEGAGWARAQHGFPLGGEGGLVSSVADLALWDRNWTTLLVGGAALTDALTTQAAFTGGEMNAYARGLIVKHYRGVRTVDHGGLWPGYKTEFLRAPEATVIVISNNGASDPYRLAHAVLDAVLDGRPGVHPAPKLPGREELARHVGRFVDRTAVATVDFSLNDAGVLTGATHGVPFQVIATPDGRLTASRGAFEFTFTLSEDGERLTVDEDAGHSAEWRRVPPAAPLPAGLPGVYASAEIAASWTIAPGAAADTLTLHVAGPLVNAGPWTVAGVDGDIIRITVPGALFQAWLDVLVLRDADGAVTALRVNAGRARQLTFERTPHA